MYPSIEKYAMYNFPSKSMRVLNRKSLKNLNSNTENHQVQFPENLKIYHAVIIRGLDSCILHSTSLLAKLPNSAKMVTSFAGYVESALYFLECHHKHEDTIENPYFNQFSTSNSEALNDSEHDVIMENVDNIHLIISELKKEGATSPDVNLIASGLQSLHASLVNLREILSRHFEREEHFVENLCKSNKVSEDGLKDLHEQIESAAKFENTYINLPFMYYNLSKEEREEFWNPNFSWYYRNVAFPWFVANKHNDYWAHALHFTD